MEGMLQHFYKNFFFASALKKSFLCGERKKNCSTMARPQAKTSDSLFTLLVERPDCKRMEYYAMSTAQWEIERTAVFFPMGTEQAACCMHYKHPGHFIFSCEDREKVVFEGFDVEEIDLGGLNYEWKGCLATLMRTENY